MKLRKLPEFCLLALAGVLMLTLGACGGNSGQTTSSGVESGAGDVNYSITKREIVGLGHNPLLRVRIDEEVSAKVLKSISDTLRTQESERDPEYSPSRHHFTIFYYLPGMNTNQRAWARVFYNDPIEGDVVDIMGR